MVPVYAPMRIGIKADSGLVQKAEAAMAGSEGKRPIAVVGGYSQCSTRSPSSCKTRATLYRTTIPAASLVELDLHLRVHPGAKRQVRGT